MVPEVTPRGFLCKRERCIETVNESEIIKVVIAMYSRVPE